MSGNTTSGGFRPFCLAVKTAAKFRARGTARHESGSKRRRVAGAFRRPDRTFKAYLAKLYWAGSVLAFGKRRFAQIAEWRRATLRGQSIDRS